eukprot:CAMPEP_0181133460 /NCGR_PEP_ID=MMETSP1071-20121207/31542_1 /TAXON_ID=35127 /ORGANISM="Thalassiosira sp., Strain NH16" /LENGTH=723 /DNA_ID=CAMNT_0023219865 /DNA_START=182 /DNA_END=2353 /DNA_ORIENTATION=+
MSTITGNDNMPLLLGAAVVVIILVAFISSRGKEESSSSSAKGKKKAVATQAAAPTTSSSKKSKKKKSASKSKAAASATAPAAEKKVVIQEPPAEPEPEPETKTATKKKKKKKKKAAGSNGATAGGATPASNNSSDDSKKVTFVSEDDSDSDDDLDLWRIQSAAKRKGGNDAAKRAAANKERDRVRALKKKEEKAKAEAKAAAAAEAERKARKEEEEAIAAAAQAEARAAAEAEKQSAEAEARAKKNGASSNGVADDAPPAGEKKKRKRKKKKGASAPEDSARPTLVKPGASPAVEQWEVVPMVEEWQEVGSKKAKQKVKMEAAAAAAVGDGGANFLDPADEEPGETSVTIPAGDDPLILIGRGGSTIQNLQDVTGARFNLDRSTNMLTISGTEDSVQMGLAEARSILAGEAERKANEVEERVTWGSDAIKAVIGRGGTNIRAAQDAFPDVRIDADVEAGTLVIVGPADVVSTALTMCHNAAFGEVQDVIELGSRNAVNLVYGPNFQTIRSLQDSTGCKLDITRGSTSLKLAGSTEAVAEATAQIRALLAANRGIEMTIENSKVGAVYGKGGETLRSIQDKTGTQIDVTRGPTHASVSVMGTADASARARNMLQRAIDGEVELQPGEVAEEIELGSATAAVIGRGGSNVAELEKKHGVKVNVRSEFQKARVVGKPDGVAAAAKEISAIAKPILEAEAAQKKADEALESGESAWQVDANDDSEGW